MRWRDVEVPFELRTAEGKRMDEDRSVGTHLSDAIRFMEKCITGESPAYSDNQQWAAFGFIFERWVEKALVEYFGLQRALKVYQQELLCDGVYLTPDAVNVSDGYYEEYKARWRSMRKFTGPDWERWFWKELVQIKAHCHVLGTRKARLVIFFVCGDWKPPAPKLACREFEFEEAELVANWRMVVANARAWEREQGQQSQQSQQPSPWPVREPGESAVDRGLGR